MELKTPFTMCVSGQTGSGKTVFVSKLIAHNQELFHKPFDKIILAFTIIQPIYIDLKLQNSEVELVEGLPDELFDRLLNNSNQNVLLVLDDMMINLESDPRVAALFTKMRHKSVSTIFLLQNFYFNSKYMRTVTRNSHFLVIFENPRDAGMIQTLGRQIFPERPKFLPDAFRQATQKPYGYLFLDLKPGQDKRLRVREGILPDEQTFVYLPK